MMEFLAWALLIVGFVLGSLGTILPLLPGATFIFLGVLLHKLILPTTFSWWIVGVIGILALISLAVDVLGGLLGAKLGGATKMGVIGGGLGGLVGLFFGLPGLLLGPFCGAMIGDLIAKRRELALLLKSGFGTTTGLVISLAARFLLLIVMMLVICFAAIF